MKLMDFGKLGEAKLDQWLQQLFQFTQNRVNLFDNVDVLFQEVYIDISGSQIQHNLGRIPQGVIEVATQQYGTAGIGPVVGKPWTNQFIYLRRNSTGTSNVMIF